MERYLKSRYKIGEQLSDNPFSATYRGSFIGTNKPVVIKIYKRGTLNSSLINRMKQKVRELSLIKHHGLAKLIDGDYGWQGFYYVREYIEGKSLEQLIQTGQMTGEKAAAITLEICQAVQQAHEKGIIHGALKPNNIFIDAKGIVKVADFVIEGEIKEAMPQKPISIMQNGKYISPEELSGNSATTSSDVYALGLLLLEMLAGQNFKIEGSLAGGLRKMREGGLFDRQTISHQPRYLIDLVNRAVQVDPLLRFRSISEFKQSLENHAIVTAKPKHEEFIRIFESSVSSFGDDGLRHDSEELADLGKVRLRWGKENHRHWILVVVLLLAVLSGIIYAFIFGI
ncbi:MAG: protein kinase [bacterium]